MELDSDLEVDVIFIGRVLGSGSGDCSGRSSNLFVCGFKLGRRC